MLTRVLQGLLALSFMIVTTLGSLGTAQAQIEAPGQVWVQIEAVPNRTAAEARVDAYTQRLDNVTGFLAVTGLYAVALGPFDPATARDVLQQLRAQGAIPGDSYIEDGGLYASQFFPAPGAQSPAPAAESARDTASAEPAVPEIAPDETPQQARQSEARLTRAERDELQIALQWFGFYTGRIDGAFGPGTRGSMQAYQTARDMDTTGILTTRQRAQLLDEYQGELAALGMGNVLDERAGVQIDLPLAMVAFETTNFPFSQYAEINDSGVRAMLISQPGDRATLFGLYEIMQTLDIVPLEGTRERGRDSFVLTGQSAEVRSHTEARLVGGAVKGFTLIWEPRADAQMARVLPMMQTSFRALDGALDPAAVPEGLTESIDLVSGLTVRQPDVVRTGFFLDASGTVLTTIEAVRTSDGAQCEQIMIDNAYPATLGYTDAALGIAVLTPNQPLAPLGFARVSEAPGRLRTDVAVAGFPFGGALSSASTSFGALEDLRGVNGEDSVQRLSVATADTEAGGPVLDLAGSVIGMVLPGTIGARTLPSDVTLALRMDQLIGLLQSVGLDLTLAQPAGFLNRENISREAQDISVRVSCWS